jgi:hypothetical protein
MKGVWRMVESVLAVMLVMGFLLTAGSVQFSRTGVEELVPMGFEKLRDLDVRGELRPLAATGNYTAINSLIDMPGYGHFVQVCDTGGGCAGNYTESKNVAVSAYIIAGYGSYAPLEIRLYMWR